MDTFLSRRLESAEVDYCNADKVVPGSGPLLKLALRQRLLEATLVDILTARKLVCRCSADSPSANNGGKPSFLLPVCTVCTVAGRPVDQGRPWKRTL